MVTRTIQNIAQTFNLLTGTIPTQQLQPLRFNPTFDAAELKKRIKQNRRDRRRRVAKRNIGNQFVGMAWS